MLRAKDDQTEQRILRDLSFLFNEHGATITENLVDGRGGSNVFVVAGNLEFRFVNSPYNQEFDVLVGSPGGQGIWELLPVALSASTGEDVSKLIFRVSYSDDPAEASYVGFKQLAVVLQPRFRALNRAFAPENYPTTRLQFAELERRIHPKQV